MREWLEETRCKLPRVSSQQSHTGCVKFLQQGLVITNVKHPPGKLVWDAAPEVFTGSWSRRHTLPSTHPNSRLLGGKQVFTINHIVCKNSLGIILCMMRTLQKSKFQMTARDQPCPQAFLRIATSSLCC